MEILSSYRRNIIAAGLLSAVALAGSSCSIDSYLTDTSNVHCDGKRTIADLGNRGMATFIVHGEHKGDVATIKVRRSEGGVSVNVSGDVTGPPQQIEVDGFTSPLPEVEGSELSTFGANGSWVIDARKDSVVIQGSCDDM